MAKSNMNQQSHPTSRQEKGLSTQVLQNLFQIPFLSSCSLVFNIKHNKSVSFFQTSVVQLQKGFSEKNISRKSEQGHENQPQLETQLKTQQYFLNLGIWEKWERKLKCYVIL